MILRDLFALIFISLNFAATDVSAQQELACEGKKIQSGLIICTAPADSLVSIESLNGTDKRTVRTNSDGFATVGLKRTEASQIVVSAADTGLAPIVIDIASRDDPFRTIKGLDCDKVDARTPDQKAHASRSWTKKVKAFATFHSGAGAQNGFLRPAIGPTSSPFGPARKYIGVGKDGEPCDKTSIHRGYDIAVPVGTDIVAPAAGIVTLGDPDLYYEGGTIFLDHGEGLVSVFMHMSSVDVMEGQSVLAGERIGASGNTGRTTGPHLHWAVKWRNPNSTSRKRDFYIDPALLLDLWQDD